MADPFDRTLPSPIADVLQLRASSESSVVEGEGNLTDVQKRMRVETGLERKLIAAAESGEFALILISGSAGGGKSLVISNLAARHRSLFGEIVEDATHADAPNEDQYQRLVSRLEPLADGQPSYSGKPLLIAMNTGMVIRLFDQLRQARGDDHGFLSLESAIRARLGLAMPATPRKPGALAGKLLLINLDHRPTAGTADGLFRSMLHSITPDLGGAVINTARCATCSVTAYCFVRTNAFLLSSPRIAPTLDAAAEDLALERGRPLQPRALWDLIADLITGGEPFDQADPCDRIAELPEMEDGDLTLWRRLAFNGLFLAASLAKPRQRTPRRPARPSVVSRVGPTGRAFANLDPTFLPGKEVHDLLAETGIDPARDAQALLEGFAAYLPDAAALPVAAAALDRKLSAGSISATQAGRAIGRARWLLGGFQLEKTDGLFRLSLEQLVAGTGDALEKIRLEVAEALEKAFGRFAGGLRFFRTEAYDPRRKWAIFVKIELDREVKYLSYPFDRVTQINPDGAMLVGYKPQSLAFSLPRNAELTVDLPLYRLLKLALHGTQPSSADLERFFQLRRAAEILGQDAAQDPSRDLLLEDRETSARYQVYRRGTALTARPVN